MMGERRVMQEALFYGFSLERHVPDNHMLRRIDRFVDLSDLRAHLGPYYSDVGRPSIDPELMIRMLIVGYCFGIRSERRLATRSTSIWPTAGFFRRAWVVNSVVFLLATRWEALGRVQASLRAQRPAALADRMG